MKLLGYCDTKSEQILVYEFMDSGTLKQKLTSLDGMFLGVELEDLGIGVVCYLHS